MDRVQLNASDRAKILMIERRVKPTDIAKALGLTTNYIYRLLRGHIVTKSGRKKIEDYFGEPIWTESSNTMKAE